MIRTFTMSTSTSPFHHVSAAEPLLEARSPERVLHVGPRRRRPSWARVPTTLRAPSRSSRRDRINYGIRSSSALPSNHAAASPSGLGPGSSPEETSQRTGTESMASSEAAYEALFARRYRSVHYYFVRRGCTQDESSELAQETFIAVYKGFDTYRQEGNVDTWLFTIAANTWRNWLRQRGTQKRTANEVSIDDTEGERKVEERSPTRRTTLSTP